MWSYLVSALLFSPNTPISILLRTNRSPAINLQINARDKPSLVTGQKRAHIRDVARVRQPSQRHIEQELLHVLIVVRHADELLEEARS